MQFEQLPGAGNRLANAVGQGLCAHGVLNRQHASLELIPKRSMTCLGRLGRGGAGLFGEFQIRVAGMVCLHHQRIARQGCGDAEFLLAPVHVSDAISGRRFDQPTKPG
jgi:hypothetical protein